MIFPAPLRLAICIYFAIAQEGIFQSVWHGITYGHRAGAGFSFNIPGSLPAITQAKAWGYLYD